MDSIMQYIAQLGFPIVAFFLLWKELGDERQAHVEESAHLAAVISNNTQALIRLTDKLNLDVKVGSENDN